MTNVPEIAALAGMLTDAMPRLDASEQRIALTLIRQLALGAPVGVRPARQCGWPIRGAHNQHPRSPTWGISRSGATGRWVHGPDRRRDGRPPHPRRRAPALGLVRLGHAVSARTARRDG